VGNANAHPARFFALLIVLSVPFYVWGVLWPLNWLPFGLPISALMIVVPAVVTTALTHREQGPGATWALWRRITDAGRIAGGQWAAVSILWMPLAAVISYAIMSRLGLPLPARIQIPVLQVPAIFALYFLGALFEEVGWTGYLTGPLQKSHGVLASGFAIGAVWAAWHLVPWWFGQGHSPSWVLGQALSTVAMRVVMGCIYAYGGRSFF